MTREMKVARYSIDLKEPLHPASFLIIDVLYDSGDLFIVGHVVISVYLLFWDGDLLQIIHHVHQMHLENIFDIKRKEGARIPRKLDIYVHLKFLS